jgi:hypothetical protein
MAETLEQRQLREQQESVKAVEERDAETEKRLGADEYVVVAPYVTLRVKDTFGATVIRGINEGAVVKAEDVDEANLRHHVETRLLAPKGHPDAEFAAPAGSPKPGEPPNVPVDTGTPVEMLPTEERIRRNREAADKATEQEKRTSRTAAKQADKQDS